MKMSAKNPGCIIFMIDQSASTREWFHKSKNSISFEVARAVNMILEELFESNRSGDQIIPRVMIGCYCYSGITDVNWAIPDVNPNPDGLIHISNLEDCMNEIHDDEFEKCISWFVHENSQGATPMRVAFEKTAQIAEMFTENYPNSYPPVIINITDGIPTDCAVEELPEVVLPIMNIKTSDGASLIFNIHISPDSAPSIFFPKRSDILPDVNSGHLLNASSTIPSTFAAKLAELQEQIGKKGFPIHENSKCLVYNADPSTLIEAIRIIVWGIYSI
jgi:hypothetical protein